MTVIKIKSRTKEVEEYDKVVVALLSQGNTVGEIADQLNENKRTMEAKISRIKREYNCTTLPQLTALFIKNKVL